MRVHLPLYSALWPAGLLSACGTTSITVTRRAPAEIDLPPRTTLAVANVEGEGGELWAEALTQALVSTRRFEVVERQRLEAALKELQLSVAGQAYDDTAMSFGQLTGAKTQVIGGVVEADCSEAVIETTESCIEEDAMGECARRTRTGLSSLEAALQVIETETGKVQVVLLEDGDLVELETGNDSARIGNW